MYCLTVAQTTKYGRVWGHLFYEAVRKERDVVHLMETLKKCKVELEDENLLKSHESLYKRYFEVRIPPSPCGEGISYSRMRRWMTTSAGKVPIGCSCRPMRRILPSPLPSIVPAMTSSYILTT